MHPRKYLLPPILLMAACAHPAPQPAPSTSTVDDRDRRLHTLVDLITSSIAPTSWHSVQYPNSPTIILNPDAEGNIACLNGTLIINQSAAVQTEISALLQTLRSQRPSISIDCQFIRVDQQFLSGIDLATATILDSFTTRLFLRSLPLAHATTTLAPHVNMPAGQTADFGITFVPPAPLPDNNHMLARTLLGLPVEPFLRTYPVYTQATLRSADPTDATLVTTDPATAAPHFALTAQITSDLTATQIQITGDQTATITVPDGKSLLLRATPPTTTLSSSS